jgi:hypothetical protein
VKWLLPGEKAEAEIFRAYHANNGKPTRCLNLADHLPVNA